MSLLFSLLMACVVERQSAAAPEVQLLGVELEDGRGNRVMASRAEMNTEGQGWGWEVQATLSVNEETEDGPVPELRIEADRSEWDLKARTVVFRGQVRATRGTMLMRCDRLDVRLGEGDAIEGAVAQGEITVTQGERLATGGRAELFAQRGELVITGSPVVQEGGNSMAGEVITLWLDDDRVDCESCTLVMENPGIGQP